jgi:hypothetical protein
VSLPDHGLLCPPSYHGRHKHQLRRGRPRDIGAESGVDVEEDVGRSYRRSLPW